MKRHACSHEAMHVNPFRGLCHMGLRNNRMRPGRTDGLHVHALQLRDSLRQGLLHAHVAGDAPGARRIVDGYQALPLLDCAWHLPGYAQPLLLYLRVERVLSTQVTLFLSCLTEQGCSQRATKCVFLGSMDRLS